MLWAPLRRQHKRKTVLGNKISSSRIKPFPMGWCPLERHEGKSIAGDMCCIMTTWFIAGVQHAFVQSGRTDARASYRVYLFENWFIAPSSCNLLLETYLSNLVCILARTFLQLYELSFCGTTKTRNKYHFKEPHHGIKEPLAGTTSKNPVVVPQRPVTSTTSKNPITVPKNPLQVPLQRTPSWYHKDP